MLKIFIIKVYFIQVTKILDCGEFFSKELTLDKELQKLPPMVLALCITQYPIIY